MNTTSNRLLHRAAWLLCVLCLPAVPGAFAGTPPQTVYRCGPDGRVYSQTPCQDGQPVSVEDSRTAAQQRAARKAAESEARSADQLTQQRHQREAAVKGQPAIGIQSSTGTAPAPAPKGKATGKAKGKQTVTAESNMSPAMRAPAPTK